jgi:glycosyltransferase involved in cell wall biosynthesis
MPHVALNAHLLAGRASYRSAGIHQYIASLLRHLPAADPDFRYTVFVGQGRPDMSAATIRRSLLPTHNRLARVFWEQFIQPLALAREHPDLLHSLAFVSPLLNPAPAVVTVYDLSFRLTPDRFPAAQRLYLAAFTAHSCRRARRVIAISESTRQDLIRMFGIDGARVDVAAPGIDPAFRPVPQPEVDSFRARAGLPHPFILYLGTLEPRKNLGTLIRAFAALHAQRPQLHLVLAGARGWMYESLFRLVTELNLTAVVHFPGFVPAADLVLWYNAAAVFAYPSLYEGFGMPVLEALACGRPVVTSTVSALPEAGGQAALLVPPQEVAALTAALDRALGFDRERLARGPAHAAKFTWQATAARTVDSYRKALNLLPSPVAPANEGGAGGGGRA